MNSSDWDNFSISRNSIESDWFCKLEESPNEVVPESSSSRSSTSLDDFFQKTSQRATTKPTIYKVGEFLGNEWTNEFGVEEKVILRSQKDRGMALDDFLSTDRGQESIANASAYDADGEISLVSRTKINGLDDYLQKYKNLYDPFEEERSTAETKDSTLAPNNGHCHVCCTEGPVVKLMEGCNHELACKECLRKLCVTQAQSRAMDYPLRCFHPQCNLLVRGTQLECHGIVQSDLELTNHYRLTVLSRALGGKKARVHSSSGICRQDASDASFRSSISKNVEKFQRAEKRESRCPECNLMVRRGESGQRLACYCVDSSRQVHLNRTSNRASERRFAIGPPERSMDFRASTSW